MDEIARMVSWTLKPWKTLSISGIRKTAEETREALLNGPHEFRVNGADELLDKVKYSPTPVEFDLVDVTVGELGFEDGASYNDIVIRAQDAGLELCPAQVGPEFRIRHEACDKSSTDRGGAYDEIHVGMEPIDGQVFLIREGSWSSRLEARRANAQNEVVAGKFPRSARFLFVLPRNDK